MASKSEFRKVTKIDDSLIENGAYVVFDWDNTLKLYNKETRELSCRVSREFLLHLKQDLGCDLYIISAIRPSKINMSTIMSEVKKLGLDDIFVEEDFQHTSPQEVKDNVYAREGNVIICGYDKAETFLKLAPFDASQGHKVIFFDDEEVNIENFGTIVPNSTCYLAVN